MQRRTTDGEESPRAEGAHAERPRTTTQRRPGSRRWRHQGGWAAPDGGTELPWQPQLRAAQSAWHLRRWMEGPSSPGRCSQGPSPAASSPRRSSPWPLASCCSCLRLHSLAVALGSPGLADVAMSTREREKSKMRETSRRDESHKLILAGKG
jgi:hypothetical protein